MLQQLGGGGAENEEPSGPLTWRELGAKAKPAAVVDAYTPPSKRRHVVSAPSKQEL